MRDRFDRHLRDEYNFSDGLDEGPREKPVYKVMIPLHKVWAFFKKKKKTVRRKK